LIFRGLRELFGGEETLFKYTYVLIYPKLML